MGGYNTFCEILSFDKRAVIVPRTQPRMEQFIRAKRAEELGLSAMLEDDGERDWRRMATALRQLPQQALPSDVVVPGLMDGLENLNRLVTHAVERVRANRTGERAERNTNNSGNGRSRLTRLATRKQR
jgi:predicted glycosyltransferase